jgi:hypothetical protein
MTNSTTLSLRGSLPSLPVPGSEEHDRILQYDLSRLTGNCDRMEVVDACRGTGVGRDYIGFFTPFEDDCSGDFEDGLPLYWNKNKKLYMYPIDIYPEHWSIRALRGLVRWRIASFKTFADKDTCRREEANIFQIDFAADGQPYNFFPTISCFDEFADDFSGFKISTITIICHDIVVSAPTPDVEEPGVQDPGTDTPDDGNLGLVFGIIAIAAILLGGGYYYAKKRKQQGKSVLPWASDSGGAKKKAKRDAKKKAKEEAKQKDDADKKNKILEEADAILTDSSTTDKESKDDSPPKAIPVIRPEKHEPVTLPRSHSRRASMDPPARITAPSGKKDDAVPDDIQKMVADLDNLLDDELKKTIVEPKKPRGRSRSLEPENASGYADKKPTRSQSLERAKATAMDYLDRSADVASNLYDGMLSRTKSTKKKDSDSIDSDDGDGRRSRSIERSNRDRGRSRSINRAKSDTPYHLGGSNSNYARDRDRSRSAERAPANDYADRGRERSRSKERSNADDFAGNDRGRSKERSRASDYVKDRDRSSSKEPPKVDTYAKDHDRSRSKERPKADAYAKDRGRSSSKERSKADDFNYAKDRGRSSSKEPPKADTYAKDRGRSRSKERPKADAYANDRGRSSSKERSKADDFAKKDRDRGRSRSVERGRASDYAKDRGRSSSKERSKADDYAKKKDRSKSVEKHRSRSLEPAGATLNASNHPKKEDHPKQADPPKKSGGYKKLPGGGWGPGSAHQKTFDKSSGKGSLDASKADNTVTKNPDGSVLVSQKRKREDGAIVTTKTKYASVHLARTHGVDV